MPLTLDWEPIQDLLDDGLEDLAALHWQELAVDKADTPFGVDWPRMIGMEKLGCYRIAALRSNGDLVGYSAFHIARSLHYRQLLHIIGDMMYAEPEHRGIGGVKLVKGSEALARELAGPEPAQLIFEIDIRTPMGERVGDMLLRLGYGLVAKTFCKAL